VQDSSSNKIPRAKDRALLLRDRPTPFGKRSRLLESMGRSEQRGFGKWLRDDLHGDGQPAQPAKEAAEYRATTSLHPKAVKPSPATS
jgi:hypothetical protein